MPVEDLGLKTARFDFQVQRYAVDQRLASYRRSRSGLEALDIWFTSPAPTGSHAANVKAAAKRSGSGLLQLASRTTLSRDGMPVKTSAGPETAAEEWLERIEAMNATTAGIQLSRELTAILSHYNPMSGNEIGTHLATSFRCDVMQALSLGAAIESFGDGRYGDAARAAFPLVEAGARGVLLALGEPLYRIETGNAEGHFPALETYAQRLDAAGMDPDWLRTIKNPVAALRNAMAHGHLLGPSVEDAAVLLRTAGLLVLLTPADSTELDRSEVSAHLRDPLGFVRGQVRIHKRWRWRGVRMRAPRR